MPEMAREPRKRAESGLVAVELFERLPGGFLLGCLLRTALAAAELLPVDDRRAGEAAFVRRSLDRDLHVRHVAAAAGEQLLQVRLLVDPGRERLLDLLRERGDDGVLDRREAVLEEERAQRRLDDRGEHVAVPCEPLELVLRLRRGRPFDEALPEIELPCHFGAGRPGDDVGANLREPPLGEIRMARVERVRDSELEDAVTEELEALVRGAALASPGGVREDGLRQLRRERVDQLGEVRSRGYWCEVT